MNKINYKDIHDKYGIICNNSVNGGDCYGESYCEFNKKDSNGHRCYHMDRTCKNCRLVFCGHCVNMFWRTGKCLVCDLSL